MKKIVILGTILIALAIVGFGGYTLYTNHVNNTTCTIGFNGLATNVTYKGAHVDEFCSQPNVKGETQHYLLDQPQGEIYCQGDHKSSKYGTIFHYIVRDSNELTGNAACNKIEEQFSK